MAKRKGATRAQRLLARKLRQLRADSRMTLEAVAKEMEFSDSTLARIENADVRVDVHAVKSLLDLYGIGGQEWSEMIQLTRRAREKAWWSGYGVANTGYVSLEADARLVRDFQLAYVPGLLQTEAYATAVLEASTARWDEEQIDREVQIRMRRQQRLTATDDLLEVHAVIDESALRRPVGGVEVMQAQLLHIVQIAQLPNVTLQVLPISVGAHVGMVSAVTILTFSETEDPDVAYIDYLAGALHLEKDAAVRACTLAFDHLSTQALSPSDSIALIQRLVDEL